MLFILEKLQRGIILNVLFRIKNTDSPLIPLVHLRPTGTMTDWSKRFSFLIVNSCLPDADAQFTHLDRDKKDKNDKTPKVIISIWFQKGFLVQKMPKTFTPNKLDKASLQYSFYPFSPGVLFLFPVFLFSLPHPLHLPNHTLNFGKTQTDLKTLKICFLSK